jgi:ACT domain-containing protein
VKRIVVMVFSYDTVCYPAAPPLRLGGGGSASRGAIVGSLTTFLAEHGATVEDVEEAEGDNCFAMIMIARLNGDPSLARMRERVREYGRTLGVSVRIQREDLFLAMHRI